MTTERQPLDWEAIEAAVYDWLTSDVAYIEGDLDSIVEAAIWEDQNIPQPRYPYASMKITAVAKEGGVDEERPDTDDTRAVGEEIRIQSTSPILLSMSISFHTDPDPRTGATRAGSTALALAMTAQASLGESPVLEHFSRANLALVKELGVRDTSLVVNGEWLSRATLDLQLRATTSMSRYTGYIDKVGIVSEDFGVDLVLDSTEE